MKIDENCNKDIGIFHIEYLCDDKCSDGHKKYHIKCNYCGFETDAKMSNIIRPNQCKHKDRFGQYVTNAVRFTIPSLRHIFLGMKERCYNTKHKDYKYYGQKGIRIYSEWIQNPTLFEEWALNNGYHKGLTIDRIDSNKDYYPENCRWVTLQENCRRAGKVNWITVNGLTMTGRQWSNYLGLSANYINKVLQKYGLNYTIEYIQSHCNH